MTGILPLAGTMQFDKDSSPPAFLNGGIVDIWLPTTTTPASIFSDFALGTPMANPFTLNAAGRFPPVYVADGAYRIRVRNSALVLQFDDDEVAAVTAAVSTSPIVVTPDQLWSTGHVLVRFDDQVFPGFVRANGRTVGSATSGASERANSDCEPLFLFLWPFANITVPAGKGASAAADWAANKPLTLPDMAGRLIGARDDLGNGAQSRITAATVASPTLAGSVGGTQNKAILQTHLPAVNFTVSGITLNDPGHTHTTPASNSGVAGATNNVLLANGNTGNIATSNNTSLVTVATQGVAASGGGGTALPTISPVMLFTVYIKL